MSPETVIASLSAFSNYIGSTLGRSPHTVRAYASDVRCLARFLTRCPTSNTPATSARSDFAAEFVTWLRIDERNSPATAKRKMAALCTYFAWLVKNGSISQSPIKDSNVEIRLPKRLPRAVPRQDVARLFKGYHVEERNNASTQLAVRMLVATGVRISELCAINVGDISPDGASIRIWGKGNRERTVFVSSLDLQGKLIRALDGRTTATSISEPLFVTRRNMRLTPQAFRLRLHRLRTSCDVAMRVTPHCLRHTAATLLLESGVDIRFVQRLLGHASISTTEVYTRVVDESLRNALLRADPLRGM
ncbi:integrase/recombinase XerD [Tahibacter aquaticus]|uniref:Integrase/recombinase XerD n=1 Tax=Tahibacter aquaticus TaxID=520092 RepID=A0A4R6YRJ2_9GAMM|nr:integrase/recombinase XerD [Tahibacter aquaticus]